MSEKTKKEYICTFCGKKEIRSVQLGRPQPGTCPQKIGNKPHSWRINRTIVC